MKVLLINASPHKDGNTARALKEIADTLNTEGVESQDFWLGVKPVRGCVVCGKCREANPGRCAFDDDVANRIIEALADVDGVVFGSPVYYGQPAGHLLAVMQRVCFAGGGNINGKPVANVAICRRGGSTAAYQTMNMMFEMLNCPIVTSQYWNVAFGRAPGEVAQDAEGMQTMRTLARNMAWLLKNLRGDNAVPRTPQEPWKPMSFIRDSDS